MSVTVIIPPALRGFAADQDEVELEGGKVSEVLANLVEKHGELKPHLFDEAGQVRGFLNIFVGDENINELQGAETAVKGGDEIMLVPAVAGGNGTATDELPELSKEEMERYARHLILPEVGVEGQKKLKAAKVLMIGTGGLGSPLGMYLAAAGVGNIGIVEFDSVDYSNLQRQIIHGTKDVGKKKIVSAAETMKDINPHVKLDLYEEPFTSENAMRIAEPYDIIVDGTDNFPTRYLVNDVCVLQGKPNVYGAIFRFDGQATVFNYEGGPCYRCLYPEPPDPGLVPSCAEGGVIGILPGLLGMIQATETIKIILGLGTTLSGRLLLVDALKMKFRQLKVRRDPNWKEGEPHPTIKELIDYNQFCGVPSDPDMDKSEAAKIQKQSDWDITPRELKDKMDAGAKFVLLDVREPHEFDICNLEGKLMPLATVPQRYQELPKDEEIIVHCKMGGRSAKAVNFLRQQGFENVWNVNGGITAWAEQIDPNVPKY